jgi:hypothetical protein
VATGHPYYDPTGSRHGVPTYPWGWVPDPDLRTKAQLRAEGLSTAGLEVAAQIMWRSRRAGHRAGTRTASLYRRSLARPVRPLTPGQQRALARALLARHTCRECGRLWEVCLPTSTGGCCPTGCHTTWEAPEDEHLVVAA